MGKLAIGVVGPRNGRNGPFWPYRAKMAILGEKVPFLAPHKSSF